MSERKKENIRVLNIFPLKKGGCSDKYRKALFENQEGRVCIILLDFEEGEN